MSTPDSVRAVIEPAVTAAGCDLEDVQIRSAGRRQLVRVLIDADGGISLDLVAQVSRDVSEAMDAADSRLGLGAYVLEVSSPGVERPLTLPRHFRRAQGRLVRLTMRDGRTVEGRITAADDERITVTKATKVNTVAVADIVSGQVQVEFKSTTSAQAQATDAAEHGDGVDHDDEDLRADDGDHDGDHDGADDDDHDGDDDFTGASHRGDLDDTDEDGR